MHRRGSHIKFQAGKRDKKEQNGYSQRIARDMSGRCLALRPSPGAARRPALPVIGLPGQPRPDVAIGLFIACHSEDAYKTGERRKELCKHPLGLGLCQRPEQAVDALQRLRLTFFRPVESDHPGIRLDFVDIRRQRCKLRVQDGVFARFTPPVEPYAGGALPVGPGCLFLAAARPTVLRTRVGRLLVEPVRPLLRRQLHGQPHATCLHAQRHFSARGAGGPKPDQGAQHHTND